MQPYSLITWINDVTIQKKTIFRKAAESTSIVGLRQLLWILYSTVPHINYPRLAIWYIGLFSLLFPFPHYEIKPFFILCQLERCLSFYKTKTYVSHYNLG